MGASYMEAVAKRAEAVLKASSTTAQSTEELVELRATFRAAVATSTPVLAQVLQKTK